MQASDIMTPHFVALGPNQPAESALALFQRHGYSSLPVVDHDGTLLGVVRPAGVAGRKATLEQLVTDVFLRLGPDTSEAAVMERFFDEPYCGVAYVVDQADSLLGIITKNDVLNLVFAGKILLGKNSAAHVPLEGEVDLVAAVDGLKEGIVVVDSSARIVFANQAYYRILGVQPHRVLHRHLSELEPKAKILEVLRTGKPLLEQKIHFERLGRTVVANITPISSGDRTIGAVSSFFDQTEILSLAARLSTLERVNNQLTMELHRVNSLQPSEPFNRIVGRSRRLITDLDLASRVSKTDATVLIFGENGVGKELLARAIHDDSARSAGPFVAVNCSAIPAELLESELFGYEEGAFTGARKGGKRGKAELADGGSLFLDEIGDLPLCMQPKLLRFLQELEVERIGSERSRRVDVRVIAATNRNLDEMMELGTFRQDLYYRISVFTINLAPLRERPEDIPVLVDHFREVYNKRYGKQTVFGKDCVDLFLRYSWPGNVRELMNVVEHCVVLAEGEQITIADVPEYFRRRAQGHASIYRSAPAKPLHDLLEEVEDGAIRRSLELSNNNKSRAIELLGISRRSFYEKLKKYNIPT